MTSRFGDIQDYSRDGLGLDETTVATRSSNRATVLNPT